MKEISPAEDINFLKNNLFEKIKIDGTIDEPDKHYFKAMILDSMIDLNNKVMKELMK